MIVHPMRLRRRRNCCCLKAKISRRRTSGFELFPTRTITGVLANPSTSVPLPVTVPNGVGALRRWSGPTDWATLAQCRLSTTLLVALASRVHAIAVLRGQFLTSETSTGTWLPRHHKLPTKEMAELTATRSPSYSRARKGT